MSSVGARLDDFETSVIGRAESSAIFGDSGGEDMARRVELLLLRGEEAMIERRGRELKMGDRKTFF